MLNHPNMRRRKGLVLAIRSHASATTTTAIKRPIQEKRRFDSEFGFEYSPTSLRLYVITSLRFDVCTTLRFHVSRK